ncbi:hypothetical protein MGYG_00740 [Nannizzia gypsea CBS 118893]|uniref:Cytochrome P450 n=1 Tax=Arthroderma gypseum (strain ATCC MYA-4604 / CBS 118893) TaxID=535722 RepID=E5R1F0_ARTGP|nr:hypothetical protein MGYG_00740 [Nannizzia gypsea CBS 118893]EFQ97701.1 hypothetical protein MGYG_00740 [Nannizzia gypsea CBS 118893]
MESTEFVFRFLFGTGIALIFLLARCRLNRQKSAILRFSDAGDCRAVIAGKNPWNGTAENILTGHQSRAGPNQALRRAFGIDNAFTSEDNNVVREFVALATNRMSLHSGDWVKVAILAATTLESLGFLEQNRSVGNSFSRTAPIANIDKSRYKDVLELADAINRIWISSKDADEGKRPRYQNERAFHDTLKAIFPNVEINNPTSNPLNLILPSFETLWRIVLRTFLEVKFLAAQPEKNSISRNNSRISASNLVSEALRLYPPTRRVHRHFQGPESSERSLFAADIEACHRSAKIWGPDALKFLPGRWNHLDEVQKASFMPFGNKPFVCPAKPVFGPRMIALLAGALLCHYTEDWELGKPTGRCDANVVTEGEYLDRDACAKLYLVRNIRD